MLEACQQKRRAFTRVNLRYKVDVLFKNGNKSDYIGLSDYVRLEPLDLIGK